MKKFVLFSLLLILSNFCLSWEIRLVKEIPVENNALFHSISFVVLQGGNLLFTDIKDKDNQLKMFNEEGKLIKAWGRMGPGPDEFGGLGFLDYQAPYLAVADAGKHRIYVFENVRNSEFKKIGDILAWQQEGNIKIYQKNILMHGFSVSPEGQKYILFMRDFNGQKTEYILPLEHNYGAQSMSEYKKIREEVDIFLPLCFMDIYEDTLFYITGIRVKVDKINLKTKRLEIIGEAPHNFRNLSLDKKTKNMLMDPNYSKGLLQDIITKRSFVSGIFADKNFVAVIYVNREKKIGDNAYWFPYVQIYDHYGKALYQQSLAPFFSEDRVIPLFYQKDKGYLYLCSIISGDAGYQYKIYKYYVQQ